MVVATFSWNWSLVVDALALGLVERSVPWSLCTIFKVGLLALFMEVFLLFRSLCCVLAGVHAFCHWFGGAQWSLIRGLEWLVWLRTGAG